MNQFESDTDNQDEQEETKKSQLSEQDQLQLNLMDGVTEEYQSKPHLGFFGIRQERADYLTSSNDHYDNIKYGALTPENEKDMEDDARNRFPNMPSPQYKARRLKRLVSPIEFNCIMNMPEVERINEIDRITAPSEQDLWNKREGVGVDEDDYDHYYAGKDASWASSGASSLAEPSENKKNLKNGIPTPSAKTLAVPPVKVETKSELPAANRSTAKPSGTDSKKDFYDSYGSAKNNNNTPREQWATESEQNIGKMPAIGTDFRDPWVESKVKAGMAPDATYSEDGKTGPIDPATKQPNRYFTVDGKKVRDASFAPTDTKTHRRSPEAAERVTVLARLTSKEEFNRVMDLPEKERDAEIARITKGRTMFNTAVRPTDANSNSRYKAKPNTSTSYHFSEVNVPIDEYENEDKELVNETQVGTELRVAKVSPKNKSAVSSPMYISSWEDRDSVGADIILPYEPDTGFDNSEKAKRIAHLNGYTGGALDGSYPPSEGESSIDSEVYHRLHQSSTQDSNSALYHEIGHAYTATPRVLAKKHSQDNLQNVKSTETMTRVKGVPKKYYLSNASEMTNALRMIKEFSFDVNDRLFICSADLDSSYKADWKPKDESQKANEQRKRIPMEIRRLYYTLDQMNEDEKKEFYDWVDENNLLPQVRLERNREGQERSSFDTLA